MSHLVLQFPCNSVYHAAIDYYELRSQHRAAQQRAQALHVPILQTRSQHAQRNDGQQEVWQAGCRSEAPAFGFQSALEMCSYTFTTSINRGQITDLLLDEAAQQHLQADLQPSSLHQQPVSPDMASDADIMQLLVGNSLTNQQQPILWLEPLAFPPAQRRVGVTPCMHHHCASPRFQRPRGIVT
jgi:hypothetical protein